MKITNGDQIERVDVTKLKVDEFVRVNTGDQIPIDGIIASGELELDESIITGESKPIYKNTLTHVVSEVVFFQQLYVSPNHMARQPLTE